MAITQAMCTSFKKELMQGMHIFSANVSDSSCDYTSGDRTATMDSTATIHRGMNIVSSGETQTSTRVLSITNATTFEMTDTASASASNQSTTFSGDTFKIALYTSSASLAADTIGYTTSNEVSGTNYDAAGGALTNVTPTTSSTTALTDFSDATWSSASITARGALIYNSSVQKNVSGTLYYPSVCVLDFGADKTSSSGDFTVVFPAADASNAIIRIA